LFGLAHFHSHSMGFKGSKRKTDGKVLSNWSYDLVDPGEQHNFQNVIEPALCSQPTAAYGGGGGGTGITVHKEGKRMRKPAMKVSMAIPAQRSKPRPGRRASSCPGPRTRQKRRMY